jgi:hypothetical protein
MKEITISELEQDNSRIPEANLTFAIINRAIDDIIFTANNLKIRNYTRSSTIKVLVGKNKDQTYSSLLLDEFDQAIVFIFKPETLPNAYNIKYLLEHIYDADKAENIYKSILKTCLKHIKKKDHIYEYCKKKFGNSLFQFQ